MQKSSNIPWLDNFRTVFFNVFFPKKLLLKSFTCLQGTFGCAAGHLRILKAAAKIKHSPLALVLEDDVHLHEARLLKKKHTNTGWWWLEHDFYDFPYTGNVIIPTDSYFSEGFTNHQPEHDETCEERFFLGCRDLVESAVPIFAAKAFLLGFAGARNRAKPQA